MRPGKPPVQGEQITADGRDLIEARAELSSCIGGIAGVEAEPKAAAGEICFLIERRVKILHLDGRIRRDAGGRRDGKAIAAFDASAKTLRVEACGELIEHRREAVGGHRVISEAERGCDIGWPEEGLGIEAGLKG